MMEFSSTEHPISWFRDRYRDGSLEIRPPYQRKPVWADRQKCSLVESILMGLPVPEVFIQQVTSAEGDTTYAVVDGQQRTRTVLQFVGAELDPSEEEHNKFALDKVSATSPWRNKTFADLEEEDRKRFFGYRFSVRYLHTDSDDEIRDMFRRLNQFLTPLNAQELRNAIYTGPLIRLVEELADDDYWAENGIISARSIRRMGDLQFVSELLIGVMHGPQGGSPAIVDQYYKQYEDYEDTFPGQRQSRRRFTDTLETIKAVLPNISQARWSNVTDYYSLFVAIAHQLRSKTFSASSTKFRRALLQFAEQVDVKLGDADAKVPTPVSRYVAAAQRGANDKARRAQRHAVLVMLTDPFFADHAA
jgi:hypothetical protein